MKNFWNGISVAAGTVGGLLGYFLGGFDGLIYGLTAFVVADYLTGVMCAIIKKELSSEVGAKGIFKKIMMFLLVGLCNIIDTKLLEKGSTLRTAACFFYIANEGISIVENAAVIGLPVPKVVVNALVQIKNKSDSGVKSMNVDNKGENEALCACNCCVKRDVCCQAEAVRKFQSQLLCADVDTFCDDFGVKVKVECTKYVRDKVQQNEH
jgi:toxin secretion/phage lysis holin